MSGLNDIFRPRPVPPPKPSPTERLVAATVNGGTTGTLRPDAGGMYIAVASPTGRLEFKIPAATTGGATLRLELEGYGPWEGRVVLNSELGDPFVLWPIPTDVDPSGIPLREIARIRGAMWSVPGPWPYGPRPGRPDNITSLGQIMAYPPDIQQQMIDTYKGYGYTHCVAGPPGGPGGGYHGMWTNPDGSAAMPDMLGPAGFDLFLDYLQKFWNNGLCPVVFLHFDNQNFQQTFDYFDPLIRNNPRAQKLIRIVVPSGWEPAKYEWSSVTWSKYAKWAREILPNALCLLHTVSDVHAPVGVDEAGNDNDKVVEGWHRIAPYIHGWLFQSSTWEHPTGLGGDRRFPQRTDYENWVALFDRNDDQSLVSRFRIGYAGWPTNSAWTDGGHILVYAAEYCSYWITNQGDRYKYADGVIWGDAAMRAGAAGYLDSGSVEVPAPR